MKKTLFILLLAVTSTVFCQDVHFRQINSASIYNNPAFVGTSNTSRASFILRNQSYFGPSIFTGFDQYIPKIKGGIGLTYFWNKEGDGAFKDNSVDLSYSYHAEFKKIVIRPAIKLGYSNSTINYSMLTFSDQIDPRYGFISNDGNLLYTSSKSYLDISSGLLIYSKNVFLSSSLTHINQPDQGINKTSKLPLKWQVQIGGQIDITSVEDLKASGSLFYVQQGNFNTQQVSIGINYKPIVIQVSHNLNNSLAFGGGLNFKHVKLFYSREKIEQGLRNNIFKAHEISLQILVNHKNDKRLGDKSFDFFSFY